MIGEGTTEGTPLSALYQYLIEGLLPCLSTFAEEYKILWTLYKDRLTGEAKPLSDGRMNLLKDFGHEMEVQYVCIVCVQYVCVYSMCVQYMYVCILYCV